MCERSGLDAGIVVGEENETVVELLQHGIQCPALIRFGNMQVPCA